MSPLLQAGLQLTIIGMGVVFVLLTMLVGIIRGMSAISQRIDASLPAAAEAGTAPTAPSSHDEIVSVIGAAIAAYRKNR